MRSRESAVSSVSQFCSGLEHECSSIPTSVFTCQRNWRSDHHAMPERLTFKSVRIRSVSVPLRRPVVSKVGLFTEWPLILIDLYTNEGVVGHSYLEPYLKH